MKYFEFDKEEEKLINAFEKGEFQSVKGKKAMVSELNEIVHEVMNRTRNINIRLSEHDLQKIKAHALKKGIPYQTLVASVLHQYISQ